MKHNSFNILHNATFFVAIIGFCMAGIGYKSYGIAVAMTGIFLFVLGWVLISFFSCDGNGDKYGLDFRFCSIGFFLLFIQFVIKVLFGFEHDTKPVQIIGYGFFMLGFLMMFIKRR